MLELKNLSIAFKEKQVIKGLDFALEENDFLGVVGRNGSGKSTLALYLAGVIPHLIPAHASPQFNHQKNIGLVMQNPSAQFFALSVKEELGQRDFKGFGIEHLMEKTVFQLSEGEKQKINLLSNILQGDQIILLDEPLELLDPFEQKRFLEFIHNFTEHTFVWFDKDDGFLQKANKKVFLSPVSERNVVERQEKELGTTVLQADFNLKFNGLQLNDVQLKLREKEKIGLIGSNGSGKTTLLKALAGLVKVDGKVERKTPVSFAPQDPSYMFYQETVAEEISCKDNIGKLQLQNLLPEDPAELSKGQKKLLSVASTNKGVSFLDEPTTWLDQENKQLVYDFINQSDDSMLIATHDPQLLNYCDRVLMLNGGMKECSNTTIRQFFQGQVKA
jgi:energy-coupling factor transport system ATP-binding protein